MSLISVVSYIFVLYSCSSLDIEELNNGNYDISLNATSNHTIDSVVSFTSTSFTPITIRSVDTNARATIQVNTKLDLPENYASTITLENLIIDGGQTALPYSLN